MGRADDAVPSELLKPHRWGHGVSVFELTGDIAGKVTAVLDSLEEDPTAARSLLPFHTPSGNFIQLGRSTDPWTHRSGAEECACLLVWGHSPSAARLAHADIVKKASVDDDFDMYKLARVQSLQECLPAGTAVRNEMARNVAKKLGLTATLTTDIAQYDVAQTSTQVVALLGCNSGNNAVIYHSPERGSTCLFTTGDNSQTNTTLCPASSGRCVDFADRPLDHVEGLDIDRLTIGRALDIATHDVRGVVTPEDPAHNTFANLEHNAGSYHDSNPLAVLGSCAGFSYDHMAPITPVVTVVPTPDADSPLNLYGRVKCETLQDLVNYTTTSSILVPNESAWRDQLLEIDPTANIQTFMGKEASVSDHGKVVAYRVGKDRLAAYGVKRNI